MEQNLAILKCLWPCGRVSAHTLKPEALPSWWQQCYYPLQGCSNETTWNLAWGPELSEAVADWADTDIFSAFLTSVLSFRGCSRAPTTLCSALKKANSHQCGVVQPGAEHVLQGAERTRVTFYHWYVDYWPTDYWLHRSRAASGHTSFLCNDNNLSSGDGHQCAYRI